MRQLLNSKGLLGKRARSFISAAALALASLATSAPVHATPVQLEGTLEVIHWDNTDKTSVTKRYLRTTDGKRYELKFKAHAPTHLTGTKIRVKGEKSGNVLALSSGSTSYQVLAAPAANTFGAQNTAVLMVNFTDNTTQPFTTAQATSTVFGSASNYFKENSNQQTWLTGNVYGWFTLPMTQTCSYYSISTAANTAAANAGIDLSQYTRFVYVFPYNSTCGWSGMGTVGGSPSDAWLNGRLDTGGVTHEMGHNLGLYHSHGLNCGSTTIGTSCSSIEYGDSYDVMGGSGTAHYNAFQKERLGWLNYGTSPLITTVTSSGTYTLEPYETSTSGVKALKILQSTNATTGAKTWYYVEFRQPLGFDSYLSTFANNSTSGVLVHTGTDGDGNSSELLDMTPSNWWNAALPAGSSFTDSTAGVTLTVASLSSTGATVSVSLNGQTPPPPTCAHANPTVSLSPGQSPTVAPGTPVTYTMSVTNTDSSACTSSQFNLSTVVPSGWAVSPANAALTLAPGASGSTSVVVTSPTTATAGYYGVNSSASNSGAASYTASTSATYSLAASTSTTQPPVAVNDSATTKIATPVKIAVLANDSDPAGKPLSVKSVGVPTHGTAVINSDNTVTYTPSGKYKGSDSFSYTITDGSGTASAMVSVQITR